MPQWSTASSLESSGNWDREGREEEGGNKDQLQHLLTPTYKIKDRENGPQIWEDVCPRGLGSEK